MRTQSLENFCAWIEQTPLSESIQQTLWVVPAVQTVHILAVAAVLISAVMINLRLLNIVSSDQSTVEVFARFAKVIWWALPILLFSGALLIVGEPARSLANDIFQLKILLLVGVLLITYILQKYLSSNDLFWESSASRQRAASSLAILSMGCWLGIICAGRWIAYTYT